MKNNKFIKATERMINPIEVGTIHFMEEYAKYVPNKFMYKMITKGAKKNPYMGFVVEPYSHFVCYELIDLEWAKKLLPDNYELAKCKIFAEDEPKYYCIFGCFNIHTSAFWGTRMEFNIIAENKETGLLSWVIVDYDTNTVSFDNTNGLHSGDTKECIVTTTYNGELLVDIENNNGRKIAFNSLMTNGETKLLAERLWIEGNLSVGYGRDISDNNPNAFSTTFSLGEVKEAIDIPLEDVEIEVDKWFDGLFATKPTKVVCFPYAQHYVSDSPGHYSSIKTKEELEQRVNNFDFDSVPNYSSKPLKRSFKIGQFVSSTIIAILIILLIMKW